ncbi:MAG: enoyl-CoA hydratase/isomerase family protein, partial [Acidobacteria bacterium]|nr:enoyl-CoA hydratase/isomerase family protein [Acidobacteriota bacterium]
SAGLDVPVLLPLDRGEIEETWRSFFQLMRALAASPIPVAAAIGGHSPAGGAVLALCCDYRVMAEGRFKIGLNEVRVGITLPSSIYRAFELVVGSRRAQLYSVSGDLFDGVEALGIGLVDELVPPEEVEERAVTWLKEQLSLPPAARAATRAFARRDLIRALDAGIETDVSATLECWFSEETQATLADLVASLSKK